MKRKTFKCVLGALVATAMSGLLAPTTASAAMIVERGFLPLSDGTQLSYILTRPDGPGPFPVALTYGPYSQGYATTSQIPNVDVENWIAEGYAHLGVNFRGTGCSGGSFQPFNAEQWGGDGAEVVEWAAGQPWANGRIGMYGLSFPGTSQLATAAFSDSGHLKAIAPWAPFPDMYRDVAYPGGVFNSFVPLWIAAGPTFVGVRGGRGPGVEPAPGCQINRLSYLGPNAAEVHGPLTHSYFDEYYEKQPDSYVERIRVPVYGCVAWQDTTISSRSFEMFQTQLDPATTWLVGNNGAHDDCATADGPGPLLSFFDRYVKGVENGWETTPHLVIPHEIGADGKPGWTSTFSTWADLAGQTTPVRMYLHAGGHMNHSPPGQTEASESYNYPATTANTPRDWAGQSSFNLPTVPGSSITYTTPPLTEDAEFLGPGSVDLWLSSTASDTEVQILVTEVRPDGQEQYVQNGWLRLSRRKLDPLKTTVLRPYLTHLEQDAALLEPGRAVLGRIELLPFNHVFRQGSAIRLSLDAPGKWLVPHLVPAVNSIHHAPDMESSLVLGWIPGGTAQSPLPACGTLLNQPCRPNATPVPGA